MCLYIHLISRYISEGLVNHLRLFKRIQNKNVLKKKKIYILVCIKIEIPVSKSIMKTKINSK